MNFKKFLESEGISEEQFKEKSAEEVQELERAFITSLQKNINDLNTKLSANPTKDELEAVKSEINNYATAVKDFGGDKLSGLESQVATLKSELEKANLELVQFNEKGNAKGGFSTLKEAMDAELNEKQESGKTKFEEFKEFVKEGFKNGSGGNFEFTVKAPETVTTGNVGTITPEGIYAAQSVNMVSEYPRTEIFLEEYLDVGSTNLASIPYVDELPGEGDAAIVAEGTLKPLIDVDTQINFSQARKVAGRMKATEEALFDYGYLKSLMTGTLKRKHDIAKQADLLGAANGLTSFATPFNAAILGGVTVPNVQHYDAIAALVAGIVNSSFGIYVPNVIFVNTLDNLEKMLSKDLEGNYIMPPFADNMGNIVSGVKVVAQPSIPIGTYIVGDFKNVMLRKMWEYTVRFGWENDDFSKNLITMVGESRYHLFINENDKRGLIAGTFADLFTALTAV